MRLRFLGQANLVRLLRATTLRECVTATFAAENYVFKRPDDLAYTPRIDDDPTRLIITITRPVNAVIKATWKEPGLLVFAIEDLQCKLENGQWPFEPRPSLGSSDLYLGEDDNLWGESPIQQHLRANPELLSQLQNQPNPRPRREQRVIDLD